MQTELLLKRFKSLMWRTGMMVLAIVVTFTAENLGLFGLSPEATVFLGLVLGEVSKYLNNKTVVQ